MKNKGISLKRLIKSFGYAFNGLRLMIVQEQNAKIHLLAVLVVATAGYYFQLSALEWIAIVIVIGGVLAAEAFNTSIETLSNAISLEYNKKIKQVKDFAAGAVLMASLTSFIVGLIVFLPKIIALFK
jgi:diacylglycerol kinase (ATP)